MVWLASCHMKAWRTKGKHKQHRTHTQSRNLNVPAQTCVKHDSQCMMPCHIVSLQSVRCHYITSGRRTEARLLSKRKSEQRPDMAASLSPSLRADSGIVEAVDCCGHLYFFFGICRNAAGFCSFGRDGWDPSSRSRAPKIGCGRIPVDLASTRAGHVTDPWTDHG